MVTAIVKGLIAISVNCPVELIAARGYLQNEPVNIISMFMSDDKLELWYELDTGDWLFADDVELPIQFRPIAINAN